MPKAKKFFIITLALLAFIVVWILNLPKHFNPTNSAKHPDTIVQVQEDKQDETQTNVNRRNKIIASSKDFIDKLISLNKTNDDNYDKNIEAAKNSLLKELMRKYNVDLSQDIEEFSDFYVDTLGNYFIIMFHRNYGGKIVIIETQNKKIYLSDDKISEIKGYKKISLPENENNPEALLSVEYNMLRGTGCYSISQRIYTLQDNKIYLSLDRPKNECESGFTSIYKAPTVHWDSELIKHTIENETLKLVFDITIIFESFEDEIINKIFPPKEVYIWDNASKTFKQIEGLKTAGKQLMSNIYGSYAEKEQVK